MRIVHILYLLVFVLTFLLPNHTFAQADSTTYHHILTVLTESKGKYVSDKRTKILEIQTANIQANEYSILSTEKEALDFIHEKVSNLPARISYTLLPDASVGNKRHGVVNLSVANLRTYPSHAAEMATQLLLGTQVDLLQYKDGEYRVRTPEGYIAWVPTSSVTAMDEAEIKTWKSTPKLLYTEEFGKAYSQPDKHSTRVSDLVYGNILSIVDRSSDFYKVKYPDGRIAYIPQKEGLPFEQWKASRHLTSNNLINSAKSMLGLPYLWGGTSVKGVDCSGLTKTAFYMNGYIIPRDASQQVLVGEQIDILDENGNFDSQKALKNLNPGDLIFFAAGKNRSPKARVTHVALYIGEGEFIQAAGLVRINSFLTEKDNYDDFQTRTVVAARRYIGTSDPQVQSIDKSSYY